MFVLKKELRYEDYELNRKGKTGGLGMMGGTAGLGGGGLFQQGGGGLGGLGGGGMGGATGGMFSQSGAGLFGGGNKTGIFSSSGTGMGLGTGLQQVRSSSLYACTVHVLTIGIYLLFIVFV